MIGCMVLRGGRSLTMRSQAIYRLVRDLVKNLVLDFVLVAPAIILLGKLHTTVISALWRMSNF